MENQNGLIVDAMAWEANGRAERDAVLVIFRNRITAMGSRFPTVADDGLPTPEVGSWAEAKYRLVSMYDKLFSTGMKNK